jgi:hypothetical protein
MFCNAELTRILVVAWAFALIPTQPAAHGSNPPNPPEGPGGIKVRSCQQFKSSRLVRRALQSFRGGRMLPSEAGRRGALTPNRP